MQEEVVLAVSFLYLPGKLESDNNMGSSLGGNSKDTQVYLDTPRRAEHASKHFSPAAHNCAPMAARVGANKTCGVAFFFAELDCPWATPGMPSAPAA